MTIIDFVRNKRGSQFYEIMKRSSHLVFLRKTKFKFMGYFILNE